jgi:hypothetical protein
MNEVFHVSFFNNLKNRYNSPAANDKISYLKSVFKFNSIPFHIYSFSWILDNLTRPNKEQNLNTHYFFSKKTNFISLKIFFYFTKFMLHHNFFRDNKNILIIYHSPLFLIPLIFFKFIFNTKYILQLEEVYSDVTHKGFLTKLLEETVIKNANKIISSSQLLTRSLKKTTIVIHGNYEPLIDNVKLKKKTSKIKLLYAGIIDTVKNGAFNAIKICQYLPSNFELHIIGSGDVDQLKKVILNHNEYSKCKVFFDGEKNYPEIIEYSKKFNFGLATQDAEKKFNSSSFPSKILFYLRLGLNVISSNSESVKESIFFKKVLIYKSKNFKNVAKFIDKNKHFSFNSINLLKLLDSKVKTEIINFIK